MPRIPPHFFDYCIYLYSSTKAARAGKRFGGSGLLVADIGAESGRIPAIYAVSNRHVVHGGHPVVRLNIGDALHFVEFNNLDWVGHPDTDLAAARLYIDSAAPLPHGFSIEGNHISPDILSRVGVGDDVFMIGRYTTHAGRQKNEPSARFGNISMLPGEEFETPHGPQKAFLVEMRSLVGYSGSPVFVHHPPWQEEHAELGAIKMFGDRKWQELQHRSIPGFHQLSWPCYLLGIHFRQLGDREPVFSPTGEETKAYVRGRASLCLTVPAWRIVELLKLAGPELVPKQRPMTR